MKFFGWLFLIASSLLNVGWLLSLRQTAGFHRLVPLVSMALFGMSSTYFLSRALTLMPASMAYIVYMGITVSGSLIFDVLVLRQSIGVARIVCLLLILLGTIGLQGLSAPAPASG